MFNKVKQFIDRHKNKILAGTAFLLGGYAFFKYYNDDTRIRLSAFFQALNSNQLDEVVVSGNQIYFRSSISDWYHTSIGNYPLTMLFQQLRKCSDLKFSCEGDDQIAKIILGVLMSAASALLTIKIMMPQNFGNINKYPQVIHNQETFQNFFGSEELKLKLKQLVDYLKDRDKYQKLGGRCRKGILLYGPPGTGKTMLAKTLANQANLPFIQTCASEFQEIFVGVGPKKIRQIFSRAKNCPQGCIIFIDELDAIGSRSSGLAHSRETTATINQLLTQLDGFESNQNIVVIGATNRPDLVDSALIRAGRFDIKVKLHLPSQEERKGILQTLLKKKNVPHQINQQTIEVVAAGSNSWSGADIQALINEGIFKAVRENSPVVKNENILSAFEEMLSK